MLALTLILAALAPTAQAQAALPKWVPGVHVSEDSVRIVHDIPVVTNQRTRQVILDLLHDFHRLGDSQFKKKYSNLKLVDVVAKKVRDTTDVKLREAARSDVASDLKGCAGLFLGDMGKSNDSAEQFLFLNFDCGSHQRYFGLTLTSERPTSLYMHHDYLVSVHTGPPRL
jgi:hypothetical protein